MSRVFEIIAVARSINSLRPPPSGIQPIPGRRCVTTSAGNFLGRAAAPLERDASAEGVAARGVSQQSHFPPENLSSPCNITADIVSTRGNTVSGGCIENDNTVNPWTRAVGAGRLARGIFGGRRRVVRARLGGREKVGGSGRPRGRTFIVVVARAIFPSVAVNQASPGSVSQSVSQPCSSSLAGCRPTEHGNTITTPGTLCLAALSLPLRGSSHLARYSARRP